MLGILLLRRDAARTRWATALSAAARRVVPLPSGHVDCVANGSVGGLFFDASEPAAAVLQRVSEASAKQGHLVCVVTDAASTTLASTLAANVSDAVKILVASSPEEAADVFALYASRATDAARTAAQKAHFAAAARELTQPDVCRASFCGALTAGGAVSQETAELVADESGSTARAILFAAPQALRRLPIAPGEAEAVCAAVWGGVEYQR